MTSFGPPFEECEDRVVHAVNLQYFGETTFDGYIRSDDLVATYVREWTIPDACAAIFGQTTAKVCRELTGPVQDWITGEIVGDQVCELCEGGGCGCRIDLHVPREVGTADDLPYLVEGTTINAGGWRQEFCVDGDRLHLYEEYPDGVFVATLRRVSTPPP